MSDTICSVMNITRHGLRKVMKPIILVPLVVVNGWTLYAMQQAQSPPSTAPGPDWLLSQGSLIGQLVIFLTTVTGFLYNIYRENRNRRWDLEDRRIARELLERETNTVKKEIRHNTQVTQAAATTALVAATKSEDMERRLAELTVLFEESAGANGHGNGNGKHTDGTSKSGQPKG